MRAVRLTAPASDIQIHRAAFSYTDLRAARDEIIRDRDLWLEMAGGDFTLGFKPEANVFELAALEHTASLDAALAASYGGRVVARQLVPDELPEDSCTRLACRNDPTMRAGLALGGCTAGFISYNTNLDTRYLMTAGHCFNTNNNEARHDGSYVGYSPLWVNGPRVDGARFRVSGASWGTAYWVYHSVSVQRFQVEGRFDSEWCKRNCTGVQVHRSGRNGGTLEGSIIDAHTANGSGSSEGFKYAARTCGGDSGGPVYSYPGGLAFGTVSARTDAASGSANGQACRVNGIAMHIIDMEQVLDITVWTN